MKIQIIVEHKPMTSGKSTKEILEDVTLTVRDCLLSTSDADDE